MATEDLPRAEYDKPGWLAHLVLGLGVLALSVGQLLEPTRTGIDRWILPLGWFILAGWYALRSRRLWIRHQEREDAYRRWAQSRASLGDPHNASDSSGGRRALDGE